MSALRNSLIWSFAAWPLLVQAQAAAPPVAGLKPDRRPEGSPVVAAAPVDPAVKSARLRGISQPWPGNVERIAEQGNWYSPMFHPGMRDPYDLRGLHGTGQPK